MMQISYHSRRADNRAFVRYLHLERFRWRFWVKVGGVPFGCFLGLLLALLKWGPIILIPSAAIAVLLAGLWVVGWRLRIEWIGRKFARALPQGPVTASLDSKGVTVIEPRETATIPWSEVRELVESRGLLIFILSSPPRFTRSCVIPRRAFPTEASFVAFRNEARRLWQVSQPSSGENP